MVARLTLPMPKMLRVILLVVLPGLVHAATEPDTARELARAWRKIDAHPANQAVRELFGFALEATAARWHPEYVESALAQAAELQDRDPASKTRGNFRWYRNQPKPVDLNAVEFCLQQAVLLWNLHREALTPAARTNLEELLRQGIAGVRSQKVDVSYTNIFLMKTWNCIAIGEALDDAELSALGGRMLDEWLAYTRVNGIHEFLSPTYSGVDVDSLALLQRFAGSPAVRAKAEAALRLLYAQSAANWFAPSRRLGGAHSRDYDYLTGHGVFDVHLADWGWLPRKPQALHEFADLTRWTPVVPLAPLPTPRFVWQRWGAAPGEYAATYLGKNFCLGSAGAAYNSDDKVLTLQFPGNAATVMGNLVVDGRGDPYGHSKEPDGNGHPKALHLMPFIASVQDGADVLFAASFDPRQKVSRHKPTPARQLATSLVLPAEAEVWSGDSRVISTEGSSTALAADRPVFIRVGNVVAALQVLAATDCNGQPVAARYWTDGAALHAARITWVQSTGPAEGEAHVVFRLRVAEDMDEAAFAGWRATLGGEPMEVNFKAGVLDAKVTRPGQPALEIHADLKTGERRASPVADGSAIITVNGRSLLEIAGIEL
jgi:hypothetical protein